MPDYYDAAQRHWDDANHLLSTNRLPNADQLFGVSAECALKAIMLPLGMPMNNGRPLNKKHGHINVLWDEFITFANGKGQRYDHSSVISPQIVTVHKVSAEVAFNCLTQAVMDGVV